jgi:hypothetical protein
MLGFGKFVLLVGMLTCLSACLSAGRVATATANGMDPMLTGRGTGAGLSAFGLTEPLSRDDVAKIARSANTHPLGSPKNPVRATMPEGQRAYLDRLICGDGTSPAYARSGNLGLGIYGTIVDRYEVRCPGRPSVAVVMDMYHDWAEDRAVPGFTIQPATGGPGKPNA